MRARVPNFAKEKVSRKTSRGNEEIYVSNSRNLNRISRDPVIKRRSIAHMDRHQPTFSSLYQLNQINDPRSSLYQRLHHHSHNLMSPMRQYGMWHARSYESGIGEAVIHIYSLLDDLYALLLTLQIQNLLNHLIICMDDCPHLHREVDHVVMFHQPRECTLRLGIVVLMSGDSLIIISYFCNT